MKGDYDVSIFIVNDDGDIICSEEYDKRDNEAIKFIMLTNDVLNSDYEPYNNSIFLYKDWWYVSYNDNGHHKSREMKFLHPGIESEYYKMEENERLLGNEIIDFDEFCRRLMDDEYNSEIWLHPNSSIRVHGKSVDTFIWQVERKFVPEMGRFDIKEKNGYDFYGFQHTIHAFESVNRLLSEYNTENDLSIMQATCMEEYFPAIYAAYNDCVEYKGKKIHGYLPSIDQLGIIAACIDELRQIFIDLNINDYSQYMLKDDNDKFMSVLSSTQYDESQVWGIIPNPNPDGFMFDEIDKLIAVDDDGDVSDAVIFPLYQVL